MKSFLIIGMGRFGSKLASDLMERGNDVMIVDRDEEIINELSPRFTNAYIGDCTNADALTGLGVWTFDAVVIAIGDDFQSSLEITALAKELGAKRVIAKACRDIQAKFLLRNGAPRPEHFRLCGAVSRLRHLRSGSPRRMGRQKSAGK